MKLSVPSLGRASKPSARSTSAARPRHHDLPDPTAVVPDSTSGPVGTEIGSLPINALAIALALMDATRKPLAQNVFRTPTE
jgi:hypothetical protein